jgi:hypothetical protein
MGVANEGQAASVGDARKKIDPIGRRKWIDESLFWPESAQSQAAFMVVPAIPSDGILLGQPGQVEDTRRLPVSPNCPAQMIITKALIQWGFRTRPNAWCDFQLVEMRLGLLRGRSAGGPGRDAQQSREAVGRNRRNER